MGNAVTEPEILAVLAAGPMRMCDFAPSDSSARRPVRRLLNDLLAAGTIREIRINSGLNYALAEWEPRGEWLAQYVLQRCHVSADGCHEWRGGTSHGRPIVKLDGKSLDARRTAWTASGRRLSVNDSLAAGCGCDLCINPGHQTRTTRQQWSSGPKSPAFRKKMQDSTRAKGKLSWEKVRAIRASSARDAEEALRYGVSRQAVSSVRAWRTWVEVGAFDQLIRQAA